jgi:hypothetical protein
LNAFHNVVGMYHECHGLSTHQTDLAHHAPPACKRAGFRGDDYMEHMALSGCIVAVTQRRVICISDAGAVIMAERLDAIQASAR